MFSKTKRKNQCPHCASDYLYPEHTKGKDGQRSCYNKKIILCSKCRREWQESDLVDGGYKYSLYGGWSFDSEADLVKDIEKRLLGSGYKLIKE